MQKEFEILSNFALDGTPVSLKPLGCGHINSTFLVKCDNGNKYNFQKINNHVFKDVDALMNNIDSVTSFLKQKTIANGGDPDRETLTVVKTKDGKNYYKENDDAYWRVYLFVDDVITLQVIEYPEHFYYAGKAFGNFQKLLADFPAEKLANQRK